MLRNYLKIALRNLRKHSLYSVINVSGLALGMACCLLILLLVRHEWSYDRFHEEADRIYRTTIRYETPGGEVNYQNMMFPGFTPRLKEAVPAIEHATRFVTGTQDVEVGNEFSRQQVAVLDGVDLEEAEHPAGVVIAVQKEDAFIIPTAEAHRKPEPIHVEVGGSGHVRDGKVHFVETVVETGGVGGLGHSQFLALWKGPWQAKGPCSTMDPPLRIQFRTAVTGIYERRACGRWAPARTDWRRNVPPSSLATFAEFGVLED